MIIISICLIPSVQTQLAKKIAAKLSSNYHTTITIDKAYFLPFSRIVLKKLVLLDQHNDTLLSLPELTTTIGSFSLKQKQIRFNQIIASTPQISIKEYSNGFNFQFFNTKSTIDTFEWNLNIMKIQIKEGRLQYSTLDTTNYSTLFKLNNIKTSKINVVIDQILLAADTFSCRLSKLALEEQCGFKLTEMGARIGYNAQKVVLKNLNIATPYSSLSVDSLFLHFETDSTKNLQLYDGLNFDISIKKLHLSPYDLTYFLPIENPLQTDVMLTGRLSGNLANLKGRDVELSMGESTYLSSSFDLVGLPNIKETFLYLDINNLETTTSDIELFISEPSHKKTSLFPSSFSKLGKISYKGNFTGFLSDLVAYGKFKTNLGNIQTDIGIKLTDRFNFSGSIKAKDFDIGTMLGASDDLGGITMHMTINGSRKTATDYFTYLQGTIDSIFVNDYFYKHIDLNGLFTNKKFDGLFELNDPNGYASFSGSIDFNQSIPNFNFFARLKDINLSQINIISNRPKTLFSADLLSNFEASNFDDMIGFIRLDNGKIVSPEQTISIDSIVVNAIRYEDEKQLSINSDLIDGKITGKYNFTKVSSTLLWYLSSYLPSLNTRQIEPNDLPTNDFSFFFKLKKMGSLIHFIDPDIEISNNGNVSGQINTEKKQVTLDVELDKINYNQYNGEGLQLHVNGDKIFTSSINIDRLQLFSSFSLYNFSVHQKANSDISSIDIFWNNWGAITNGGSIFTETTFLRNDKGLNSEVQIHPSNIIINDTVWNIKATKGGINQYGFWIDNFRLWHNNQQITIDGSANKVNPDGLNGYVRNISLSDFFKNIDLTDVNLSGLLNGEFSAKNIFNTPEIIGELTIDDLMFNGSPMGQLMISSSWDNNKLGLNLKTDLIDEDEYRLKGEGHLSIKNKQIEFASHANKLDAGFLNLYLNQAIQNLSGNISGDIQFNGPLSSPVLTARVKLEDGRFSSDILNTTYSISDSAIFLPGKMIFKNMTIRDKQNHKGVFYGTITHDNFSNLKYDLIVDIDNFLALDTRQKDNPLFYGSVYATGEMLITGSTDKIVMDINGRTRENTQFYIPLQDAGEISDNSFVQFLSTKNTSSKNSFEKLGYTVDLSGLEMNMDLDITPDAKIQIIFNPLTGDVLKGTGNGNIQLKIDKYQHISIFGDYLFEDGDYLFSFQNFVNKRFQINKGSQVRWDGDPYNAIIHLNAIYKLRTSLYDLAGASYVGNIAGSEELKKRIPINCNLILTDRLLNPSIAFSIETPNADESTANIIRENIHTQEDLNKQVLSLLVLNRFYSPESQKSSTANSALGNKAALVTTTEVLSNQFSNWLSQINEDLNVGFSYRPDDGVSSQEVEVALGTQLFNDRVNVNGNFGYGESNIKKTTNFISDYDVNIKLNKSGTISAKGFSRTNNDITYTTSPTKQGVGLSFKEEFDTWGELFKKYWDFITGENRREKKKEKSNKTVEPTN